MEKFNGHTARSIGIIMTRAGVAKAEMKWTHLAVKSLLGGMFAAMGGLFSITVAGGAVTLRRDNPSVATLLGALVFCLGFVLIIITNTELATANMMIMVYSALERKTSIVTGFRVLFISYFFNVAGCLFFAWFFGYWTNTLGTPAQKEYAIYQSNARVMVSHYWSTNFLKGVGCNWLVCLASFLSTGAREYSSKIIAVSFPVWAFGSLGYQHSIANFFLIPIGMFYGTEFGVGEFLYRSVIPVTLGNIVAGSVCCALPFWYLYGRQDGAIDGSTRPDDVEMNLHGGMAEGKAVREGLERNVASHAEIQSTEETANSGNTTRC